MKEVKSVAEILVVMFMVWAGMSYLTQCDCGDNSAGLNGKPLWCKDRK